MMRLLVDRLVNFSDERLAAVFGKRLAELTGEIVEHRREDVNGAFDALHRQYPDYVATLEVRFLRQSALRLETRWYQALFEEGLIPQELYDDLKRGVARTRVAEPRPRFEIGLDTDRLIERLDILSGLDEGQLWRVAKLLRPRFTVPNERIIRQGDRGDAVFFIASGAVEVRLPARRIRLGSGEFLGEMALLFRAIAAGRCGRSDLLSAARVAKNRLRALPGSKSGSESGDKPGRRSAALYEPGRRRSDSRARLSVVCSRQGPAITKQPACAQTATVAVLSAMRETGSKLGRR
jgi:CRP-like cAMP-binding protein